MHRSRRRHPQRSAALRGPLVLALQVFCAVLLAAVILAVVVTLTVLRAIPPVVLLVVAALAVGSIRRRGRRVAMDRRRAARTAGRRSASSHPPRPLPAPPGPDWAGTRARFDRLRTEYGQFECDPLAVLRWPALADVSVPATGRFVDAFAEAQALDTDAEPPAEHGARFGTAVDRAWRAWHAARDAAERIRLSGIPAEERATVQRAIKLLTVARDSGHDAERSTAYAKARSELAKLDRSGALRLPPAAAAAVDAAARGQLPPAPGA